MYDIYQSQSCSVTQLGIIKSIIQNKYDLVFNCIAKLYTSEKQIKRFLYSDLRGCLCLAINLTTLNFHFLLYDLETYETLFNAILYDNFINGYSKLRQDFHCFEVINGFIGFYFEDVMQANQLIDIITKQQNEAYAKERSNEYKYVNEDRVKEMTNERIKEIKDYMRNEYNTEANDDDVDSEDKGNGNGNKDDKQLVFNEGKITEAISHFYYNDLNEKVTYIGNKSIGHRLIKENKLPKEIIEVLQGENKGINDIDSFISIMAKHLINEDNAIKELTNTRKAKANLLGSKTFDKTISDIGYTGDDVIMPSPSKKMCRNTLLSIRNTKTIVSKDSSSMFNYQESMSNNNNSNRQSIYSIYEPNNKMRNTMLSKNSNSNSNKGTNSDMRSSHFNMRIKKQISWRVDNKKNRLRVDSEEEIESKDKEKEKDKTDANSKKDDDIYKPIDSIIDEENIQ